MSADDILNFFPENRLWYFMQIISFGSDLNEMSKPVFWEKYQFLICFKFSECGKG